MTYRMKGSATLNKIAKGKNLADEELKKSAKEKEDDGGEAHWRRENPDYDKVYDTPDFDE